MTDQAMADQTPSNEARGYTDSMDEILALIKGRVPVIWVLTHEENRFIADFKRRIAQPHKRQLWVWSGYQGLVRVQGQMGIQRAVGEEKDTHVIAKCFERIAAMPKAKGDEKGICYIMRDMQIALPENITRQLRDMFEHLIGHGKTMIILSPMLAHGNSGTNNGLPPTMEKHISVVTYELPDEERIQTRIIDILAQMKQSVKNQDKKIILEYPDEELIKFARALRGLTLLEVDNAVSTSMTHLKVLNVAKLINEKKQIISKSDMLEFVSTPVKENEVGGLNLAKAYFSKYALAHTEEAQAFGVEPLKGVILTGVPGCLAENTKILYNRGKRSGFREITLEKLYARFNQLEDKYSWDIEIPTYLYSLDGEGHLVKNRLLGVTDSGIKETQTITTSNGQEITLTADHPVCTSSGEFFSTDQIKEGMKVLSKGSMKPQFNGGKKLCPRSERKIVETLKYYPHGDTHIINECTYQRTNYARLVIEAHMNAMDVDQFINILKTSPQHAAQLKYLPKGYNVHHIDENPQNDDISNLMVLEHAAHSRLHAKTENFNVDYVQEVTVFSVKKNGPVQTYDVQMEYPNNNFVANGFIVHNTGKSLMAKMIGSLWELPLLRLDMGKVMGSLVGQSIRGTEEIIWWDENFDSHRDTIAELVEKKPSTCRMQTYDDNGFATLAKVVDFIQHPITEKTKLYKLKLKSGREIVLTGDHGVLTPTQNLKLQEQKVSEIIPGQLLAMPGYLSAPSSDKEHTWLNGFLAGAWLGDGDYNGKDVRYHLHIDDIPSFTQIFDENNINYSVYNSSSSKKAKVIHVRNLQDRLQSMGFTGKTKTKRVSENVFGYGKEFIRGLLSGYFSINGSFRAFALEVSSASKLLIHDIAYLLHMFNIYAFIHSEDTQNGYSTDKLSSYRICVTGSEDLDRFKTHIGFVQDYKAEKLGSYQAEYPHGNYIPVTEQVIDELRAMRRNMWETNKSRPYNFCIKNPTIGKNTIDKYIQFADKFKDGPENGKTLKLAKLQQVRWMEIESIDQIDFDPDEKYVYDLSIPGHGTEKFIAGSCPMLVHNSENQMRQVVQLVEAMAPCVTGETIISTKTHGDITAEKLHEILTTTAEEVLIETLDPTELRKMTCKINTVIRKDATNERLLKITLKDGKSITITENHKFLVRWTESDYGWVEARNLHEDNDLVELDFQQ